METFELEPLTNWAPRWRRGETILVQAPDDLVAVQPAERALLEATGVLEAATVPVRSADRLLGLLTFASLERGAWRSPGRALLEVVAELVAGLLERVGAARELHLHRERLELAQMAGRSIVWEWDLDTDEMALSPFAMELFGAEQHDVPRSGQELMRFIPPEDREAIAEGLRLALKGERPYVLEHRVVTPRGETRWLAVRGQVLRQPDGGSRVLGVSADITEHRRAEEALYRVQERAAVTLASIGDGVLRTDGAGRIDYMNPVAEELTGCPLSDAAGQPFPSVYRVLEEHGRRPRRDPVAECLEADAVVVLPGPSVLVSRDGQEHAIRDSAAPIRGRSGEIEGAVLVVQDVSQLRALEREMTYLARHDPLTGLINRREFEHQLDAVLASARRGRRHALCYLDLDEFKLVNDTCGHGAGDELLKQLTSLLSTQVREGDTLARLGGDELGVILRDCPLASALEVAEKLRATVRRFRFTWEGRAFEMGASIGVVPVEPDSGSRDRILSAADSACYVAKEEGRNRVHLYQPDDEAVASRYGEMQWAQRIGQAFEEERFRLYHQPIVPLAGGRPEMSEILLRMLDPRGEPFPTASFIKAAERYHLMTDIDRWVVSRSLRLLAARPGTRVFTINLSGQSLGAPDFLPFVVEQLEELGVDPTRICFEITETATITHLGRARELIETLRRRGCRFVLDDFGTGLASFAYLKTLPVDFLKIDGEFVREMARDSLQRALVESIQQIGSLLGLVTIAEWVETPEVVEILRGMGVAYGQGYALGRPEPL
jgi:diguanylate cyclase (GGDEF)-like protein/PAS domain S-box-containing protein